MAVDRNTQSFSVSVCISAPRVVQLTYPDTNECSNSSNPSESVHTVLVPPQLATISLSAYTPVPKRAAPTPKKFVNKNIAHPLIPSSQPSRLYAPISFNFLSIGQVPIGHLNVCLLTFTNPACSIKSFVSSAIRKLFPNFSPHSQAKGPHSSSLVPVILPSSDFGITEISVCSNQPPGLRCSLISEYKAG